MDRLSSAIYETVHRNNKTVEQIALETGLRTSTLYRYGLPPEASGLDIPTRKLAPLMKAAGYFEILRVLCAACGFLLVSVPRAAINRRDEDGLVHDYQKACHEATACLIQFFEKPDLRRCNKTIEALRDVAQMSVGIEKRVKRHNQFEFDF